MGGVKNFGVSSPRLMNPQTNLPWHFLIFYFKINKKNVNFDLGNLINSLGKNRSCLDKNGLSPQPLIRMTWGSKQWLRGFHSNLSLHS